MKKLTEVILLCLCIAGLCFCFNQIGRLKEQERTREKLNMCIHAPTPVNIGDSLYLIRVYPIETKCTKRQRTKYLEHNELICPYCDSDEISADHMDFDDDYGWRSVVCTNCNGCWTETYILTDAHPFNE
jgi:hypothetical protein